MLSYCLSENKATDVEFTPFKGAITGAVAISLAIASCLPDIFLQIHYRLHLMALQVNHETRYDVAANISRLFIYEDDELKLQYDIDSMKSLLWDDYQTKLVILINHGRNIKMYTIEKQSFSIEQELVVDVGYQIESFYTIWPLSTILIYDNLRAVLDIYNIDKRQDLGYITIDSENSLVHVSKDLSFQAIVVNYDNQLKTISRFCNSYEFDQPGQVVLQTSVQLPVGYYKYHVVRPGNDDQDNYPIFGIVMTTMGQDKSLVYLLASGASRPFKTRTVYYTNASYTINDKWLDPKTRCLYIKTNHELISIPLFQETTGTL
ncbi:unnamed protein product [Kluyveromyces dobzhanskii CBS 2104]|uniref:WGS project CCBQ000000000 data, contig 00015 n=1 Tax=Kluyveromyces dobzhanskii CBS 2104 TaxID=1427455 RepID=A0A0A8LBS8_9SACH|nr:unnamed protein product [Kluyveromyces dobzhanskii CBS 2104]